MAGDPNLMLDGLLLSLVLAERLGEQTSAVPGVFDVGYDPAWVPLRTFEYQGQWIYQSSFPLWQRPYTDQIEHWHKRFDSHYAEDYTSAKDVIIAAGVYKPIRMSLPTRCGQSMSWFCDGDGDEIKRLLRFVTGIGKKRNYGYGKVLRWVVEFSDQNPLIDENGNPRRPVPTDMWEGLNGNKQPLLSLDVSTFPSHPPYWHQAITNLALCVMPPGTSPLLDIYSKQ